MKVQIKLNEGAQVPVRAHETDSGYDVFAASEPNIVGRSFVLHPESPNSILWDSIDYIEYDTGISVAPEATSWSPDDAAYGALDVRPRSSISKYNLVLANPPATIDHSYRGTIKLRFKYIVQPEDLQLVNLFGNNPKLACRLNLDKIYKKGDKIGQILPYWAQKIEWEVVDQLSETKRGDGGFGSSGR